MNQTLRSFLIALLAGALLAGAGVPLHAGDDPAAPSSSPTAEELIHALTPAPGTPAPPVRTRGFSVERAKGEAAAPTPRPSVALRVEFAYDSAKLRPQALSVLAELGKALASKALRDYHFRIIGHTDAAGSAEYNQSLSMRRARAVAQHLANSFDIPPARMDVLGRGEEQPLPGMDPRDGRNRRVEVVNLGQLP